MKHDSAVGVVCKVYRRLLSIDVCPHLGGRVAFIMQDCIHVLHSVNQLREKEMLERSMQLNADLFAEVR